MSSFGPGAPEQISRAKAQPLFERLETQHSIALDALRGLEVEEARGQGRSEEADAGARALAAAEVLGPFSARRRAGPRGDDGWAWAGFCSLPTIAPRMLTRWTEVALLEDLAIQASVVLENSRQYRQLQARDRLAVLGQMAAGLAHEIKNPLGAIKGAAQLLDGDRGLASGDHEFVSIILEEVDRLDRVVGSVLDYARPAPGKLGEVEVGDVIQRTVRFLDAERSGCELLVQLDPQLPKVRADAEQIRQVLINLVRNAVQAMGDKGTVRIGASILPSGRGTGRGDPEDGWMVVTVKDDGPGIPAEVRDSLFMPFVTTKQKGTGLGLAISERIVEEMGGRIEVSSRAGEGTTFSIVLPVGTSGPDGSLRPGTAAASELLAGGGLSDDARETMTSSSALSDGALQSPASESS